MDNKIIPFAAYAAADAVIDLFLAAVYNVITYNAIYLGDRFFTAAGPRLWNNLPLYLRDFELSLLEVRRLVKTQLFGW